MFGKNSILHLGCRSYSLKIICNTKGHTFKKYNIKDVTFRFSWLNRLNFNTVIFTLYMQLIQICLHVCYVEYVTFTTCDVD